MPGPGLPPLLFDGARKTDPSGVRGAAMPTTVTTDRPTTDPVDRSAGHHPHHRPRRPDRRRPHPP
ncbi:hypothetical protein EQG64_27805 [Streptomyces sp. S6]|nr:hypothetical protein EQG64_27805 [Streptomyces sp. S6]